MNCMDCNQHKCALINKPSYGYTRPTYSNKIACKKINVGKNDHRVAAWGSLSYLGCCDYFSQVSVNFVTCRGKFLIVLVMKCTHFSVSIKQYSGLFLNCGFLGICSLCWFPADVSTVLYKLSHCIKVPHLFFC